MDSLLSSQPGESDRVGAGAPRGGHHQECSHRITDVVAAWHDANPDQQARLAAGILSQLHVRDGKIHAIRPRPAWIPYFEELLASRWSRERETSLELSVGYGCSRPLRA